MSPALAPQERRQMRPPTARAIALTRRCRQLPVAPERLRPARQKADEPQHGYEPQTAIHEEVCWAHDLPSALAMAAFSLSMSPSATP
jgi:hypothetical protein